jgi:ComF family protein
VLRPLLAGLVDLLAPRRCVGCDEPLAYDVEIACGACDILFDEVTGASAPPAPSASLYVFGGPLADGIRRFKYGSRVDLAAPLGALTTQAAPSYVGRVDVVVPVPLHRARLVERGFNQAALLAAPLARALGVPLDAGVVTRVRATPPQAGLGRAARRDNVRGAFVARRRPRGARVLVIDDVRTTGATLFEVGQALYDAGATEVRMLTLARAEDS